MKEQDFETYWRKNRQTLLQADKGYQQAAKQFKTTSGAVFVCSYASMSQSLVLS